MRYCLGLGALFLEIEVEYLVTNVVTSFPVESICLTAIGTDCVWEVVKGITGVFVTASIYPCFSTSFAWIVVSSAKFVF